MPILTPDYSNLNYSEIAASIGLKEKYLPILLGSFVDETKTILVELQKAIDATDYKNIKLHAHSIKGSSGNLKLNEIYEMAKEIEASASDTDSSFNYQGYLTAIDNALNTL